MAPRRHDCTQIHKGRKKIYFHFIKSRIYSVIMKLSKKRQYHNLDLIMDLSIS